MRKTLPCGTLAIASIAPALAWAHPEHVVPTFVAGFLHPYLGLDHVLAMIAVGIWAAQMGARAIWAVPIAFVAAMLAGAALGLSGLDVTALEPLVAATVLVLGILIMSRSRASVVEAASLTAAFAVFHGAAHVADSPVTANLVAYGAGLTVATMILHVVGISAALVFRARENVLRVVAAPVAFAGAWLLLSRIA